MIYTNNPSTGIRKYHYSNNIVKQNDKDKWNYDVPLSRYERRKRERKLKKKINKYLKDSNK